MNINKILLSMMFFVFSSNSIAQTNEQNQSGFTFTVSAGTIYSPSYVGSDEYQTIIFPNVSVSYGNRFKASLRGVEYVVVSQGVWKAGTLLTYNRGREENPDDNPLSIAGTPTTDLMGLGDIDATVELGGFVEFSTRSFNTKFKLIRGIDRGHEGVLGEASVSYRGKSSVADKPLFYSIGPAISFGDDAYNSKYFGVTDNQSTNSGLAAFNAGAGVNSIGLHASAMLPLSKSTSFLALAKYDELTGDVGKSSLVNERGAKEQLTAGLLINYRF